jgi:hypothetical protein
MKLIALCMFCQYNRQCDAATKYVVVRNLLGCRSVSVGEKAGFSQNEAFLRPRKGHVTFAAFATALLVALTLMLVLRPVACAASRRAGRP